MNSFVPNTLRRRKSTTEGKASYIIRFFNQYNMKVVDSDILCIPNIFPSKYALDEIVCLFNSAKSSWYSRDCTFYIRKHHLKLVTWTKIAPKKFFLTLCLVTVFCSFYIAKHWFERCRRSMQYNINLSLKANTDVCLEFRSVFIENLIY